MTAPSSPPTFTVVIPTFNRRNDLHRTLARVLAQSYDRFDVVVVDDGSTDDTPQEPLLGDERVGFVVQPNRGPSAARNTGVQHASGGFVTFVDTGDEPHDDWLARFAGVLQAYDADVASCGAEFAHADGRSVIRHPRRLGPAFSGLFALVQTGCLAIRRDTFNAIGGFDEDLRFSENTELAMRLGAWLAAHDGRTVHIVDPLITRHVPEGGSFAYRDDRRYETARYLLEHHGDALARQPRMHATYLRLAGVSAARQGRHAEARRMLGRAAAVAPRDPRNHARFLLSLSPTVQRALWKPRTRSEEEHPERQAPA